MAEKKPGAGKGEAEFSIIPHAMLRELYARLLKNSAVAAGRGKADEAWSAVEAAGPGVCLDLRRDDLVVIGKRSERLRVAAGLEKSAAQSANDAEQRLPELIGKALAYKTQKSGRVAVAFWREADDAAWLDAMEIARAHGLPIVFVCPRLSETSAKQVASYAKTPGTELPTITVDGHDPVAVYRVAHESIDRARRGRGATLIECGVFRVAGVRKTDAVTNIKRYMKAKNISVSAQ